MWTLFISSCAECTQIHTWAVVVRSRWRSSSGLHSSRPILLSNYGVFHILLFFHSREHTLRLCKCVWRGSRSRWCTWGYASSHWDALMIYARSSCCVVWFQFPDAPDLSTRRRHTPGGIIAVQLPKLEMPPDIVGYFLVEELTRSWQQTVLQTSNSELLSLQRNLAESRFTIFTRSAPRSKQKSLY